MAKSKKKKQPTQKEVDKLRKAIDALTKDFFATYGGEGGYAYLLAGPGPHPPPKKKKTGKQFLLASGPGPHPPPKFELTILDLTDE
jgi:hypothetical protein